MQEDDAPRCRLDYGKIQVLETKAKLVKWCTEWLQRHWSSLARIIVCISGQIRSKSGGAGLGLCSPDERSNLTEMMMIFLRWQLTDSRVANFGRIQDEAASNLYHVLLRVLWENLKFEQSQGQLW